MTPGGINFKGALRRLNLFVRFIAPLMNGGEIQPGPRQVWEFFRGLPRDVQRLIKLSYVTKLRDQRRPRVPQVRSLRVGLPQETQERIRFKDGACQFKKRKQTVTQNDLVNQLPFDKLEFFFSLLICARQIQQ